MKKLLSLLTAFTLSIGLFSCTKAKQTNICIVKLGTHTSLDEIESSIKNRLIDKGYGSEKYALDFYNANFSSADSASIMQSIKNKADVVVAIATPVAQAAYNNLKDTTPIVFAAVSDPMGAHLVSSLESPKENITGTSDEIQVDLIIDKALEINPTLSKLGFIYNPSEDNSVSNKAKIEAYCKEKKIEVIVSIRDESGNGEVRFVVELAKGVSSAPIIAKLFKFTRLEDTYSFNQVALVNKEPRLLNLKQLIEVYLEHQKDVLKRATQFDLEKVKARIHILEGLILALENIDNVIALIKQSNSPSEAVSKLMTTYHLTEIQGKAIVDMKLSRLTKLEKIELETEKQEKIKEAERLESILKNPIPELERIFNEIKTKYGDSRRTTITQIAEETKEEKEIAFVEPEKCVVVLTEGGCIKRIPTTSYRTQKRNGKGIKTQDDITNMILRTNTIDSLMIFTDRGKMYRLLVNDIPVGTNVSVGQSIKSLVAMDTDENPAVIYSIYRDTDAKYVFFTTKNGLVKKTTLEEYVKTKKKTGIAAISIKEGDELVSVCLVKDEPMILLTKNGYGIKFSSMEIGATSRATSGVKGITINPDDEVIAALPLRHDTDAIAIISETGLGKKFSSSELPLQKRAGKGLICYKPTNSTGFVADGALISDEDNILIIGDKSSICVSATEIPELSRASIGNQIIKNNKVKSISKV